MQFTTYAEAKERILDDLDLQEETFIKASELKRLFNKSVKKAEAKIHTIYEDYFLTSALITILANQSELSLPCDIYAQKIRAFIYDNGVTAYKLRKIPDFRDIPFIEQSTDIYAYLLTNAKSRGPKVKLYPTPLATDSTSLTCWYLRQARKIVNDSDEVDIPEFIDYVIEDTKLSCMKKEGHPLLAEQMKDVEDLEKLMIDTLTAKVVDDENKIQMDLSFYRDMV